MQRLLKFKESDKLFFVSDTHFNHDQNFLYAKRGFADVASHDAGLIERWNATVPEDAIVFHLGDFCLKDPDCKIALQVLKQLNYKKLYMLWGNHNSGVKSIYRKEVAKIFGDEKRANAYEVYPMTVSTGHKKNVIFLGDYQEIKVESQAVVLCHYALRNWHHNGRGTWMLCGHSHANDAGINPATGDRNILDLSIENFGSPVSFSEVKTILDTRPNLTEDHH